MPNIKSAKKRVLVNAKKTEQNKIVRSQMKTAIKKVDLLIKENKLDELQAALDFAFKAIDVAATKNIIHANNASNKKAKLAKKVFAASKGAVAPIVEEVKEEVAPIVEEVKEEVAEVAEAPVKKPRARKTTAKKEADAE